MKKNYQDFILLLEKQFGPLTPQAEHCAEDFYENYDLLISKFKDNSIQLFASSNVLAQKLPSQNNTKYQTFNGLTILLVIVGIILFFFNWKIALLAIAISFCSKYYSNYLKNKNSTNFTDNIMKKISQNEFDGFFDIAQYYIAGIIQIRTNLGSAHLPLLPSSALTGTENYARMRA